MSIKRNDLLAAANAGILHHREVDPLLVFLTQRDIHERQSGERRSKPPRLHTGRVLLALFGVGVLGAGVFMALQRFALI